MVYEHLDDFNWVPVYTGEAHALDIETTSSNCPDLPIAGCTGSMSCSTGPTRTGWMRPKWSRTS